MRRKPGVLVVGIVICAVAIAAGCSSVSDRQFRAAVVPVLRDAAKLESLIGLEAPKSSWGGDNIASSQRIDSNAARAIGTARVFRLAVRELPTPTSRDLLLLRSSLERLGVAAEDLILSESGARRSMVPHGIPETSLMGWLDIVRWSGRGEGVSAARFADALLTVAAAEEVALGSTLVRTEGKWFDPVGAHPEAREFVSEWPDSQLSVRITELSSWTRSVN